ncbi:hypothetical protein [Burkholderia oklahomensis]|uniref:hypothetical protein n=1 Tax=Burkholderia oklahomensis TaxID=342113 RepID=UPI0012FD7227|nr:hypothetical protein [Burkholderia oklahomensis]QPS36187.1 hypothetical protein I6G57_12585 [Burkholderia oklahomensis]
MQPEPSNFPKKLALTIRCNAANLFVPHRKRTDDGIAIHTQKSPKKYPAGIPRAALRTPNQRSSGLGTVPRQPLRAAASPGLKPLQSSNIARANHGIGSRPINRVRRDRQPIYYIQDEIII